MQLLQINIIDCAYVKHHPITFVLRKHGGAACWAEEVVSLACIECVVRELGRSTSSLVA